MTIIGLLTLTPNSSVDTLSFGLCIVCGPQGGIDFFWNVVLFVPLGIVAGTCFRGKPWFSVLLGAFFSLVIEALQLHIVAGRDSSVGDLISNTVGTAIGVLTVYKWESILRPSQQTARRLWISWSCVVLIVGASAAWLLLSAPPRQVYWSQWAPTRVGYNDFDGQLLELTLLGKPIDNATRIDPTSWTPDYAHGVLKISAKVVADPSEPRRAIIARAGNPLGEQFQLAQDGTRLWVRVLTRSGLLRLRSPNVPFDSVLTAGSHQITVDARDGTIAVVADGRRMVAKRSLGDVWQVLSLSEVWSPLVINLAACGSMILLLLPAAYYDRRQRSRWFPLNTFILSSIVLVAIPLVSRIPIAGVLEGGAFIASVFAAYAIDRLATRRAAGIGDDDAFHEDTP